MQVSRSMSLQLLSTPLKSGGICQIDTGLSPHYIHVVSILRAVSKHELAKRVNLKRDCAHMGQSSIMNKVSKDAPQTIHQCLWEGDSYKEVERSSVMFHCEK